MIEIFPDKRKLINLVEQGYEGKLCLPDFQRDFVWPREGVADLVRSVVRGYFIGSLLLLRCNPDNPPFAPRFIRGAKPALHEPRPDWLVLDGQQRLTSLLYALAAPALGLKDSAQRRWFYLDLNLLLSDPSNDAIVFDRSIKELDGLDKLEVQYARRFMPCTELFSLSRSNKWVLGLRKWLKHQDPVAAEAFEDEQESDLSEMFHQVANFQVALIELPQVEEKDSEALGRVCAIFEKLNSTGVDLSVYDLLTARLYRSKIELHRLWNDACAQHPLLKLWSGGKADTNKFGVLLLRTLALLRGLEVKPSVLINLDPVNFEHDWRRAAAAMEAALELVTNSGQDGFGVINQKWLPGFALLPVLAALRAAITEHGLGPGPRADLRHWYWSNVFLERYSSAVESKSRKDYMEMYAHWLSDAAEPAVFAEARDRIGAPRYRVRDSASYASAVYSGVFCLLVLSQARDWRRGESIQLQALQDHHIFPQAYLRRQGVIKNIEVNSIVNRTLISDETNNKIKDKAPADYLGSQDIFPAGATDALLAPHFLTDDAVTAMRLATGDLADQEVADVYDEFRQAREKAIVAEIRRVCGIAPADSLTTTV